MFLLADGDTQVVVKSFSKDKGDDGDERAAGVKTTVTADATADVTGDGSWSADVFGTGVVTIPYTVSWDGNNPTITIGDIVLPAGVTAEIGEPKVKVSDEGSKYKISVKLSNGEDDAKVAFHASARVDDDGELKVKLAVSLDAKSHVRCWDDDDRRDRDDRDDDDRVAAMTTTRWPLPRNPVIARTMTMMMTIGIATGATTMTAIAATMMTTTVAAKTTMMTETGG